MSEKAIKSQNCTKQENDSQGLGATQSWEFVICSWEVWGG